MKMALVFGAGGGVGSVLCRLLEEADISVCAVHHRQAEHDRQAVQDGNSEIEFEKTSGDGPLVRAAIDATNSAEVQSLFERLNSESLLPQLIASCIGSLHLKPAHLTKDEEWYKTLHTNLTSSFFILREVTKHCPNAESLVFVSTAAAQIGLPNHEAIAAAKGGIDALVRSAASGYASKGLRVNAIAPGLVDTPLTKRITSNDNALKASTQMHALGRIGQPEDIAKAMQWLLSSESAWLTGQIIAVDGGLSCLRSR